MNVGPTNSARAIALRNAVDIYAAEIRENAAQLRADKRALARLHKELADLAVAERRDKLHVLLVSKYPDGMRVDDDELLDDFRALAGLRVGSFETMRQDLLELCAKGRAWRRAIPASPKPGRVYVYGPVIAK